MGQSAETSSNHPSPHRAAQLIVQLKTEQESVHKAAHIGKGVQMPGSVAGNRNQAHQYPVRGNQRHRGRRELSERRRGPASASR